MAQESPIVITLYSSHRKLVTNALEYCVEDIHTKWAELEQKSAGPCLWSTTGDEVQVQATVQPTIRTKSIMSPIGDKYGERDPTLVGRSTTDKAAIASALNRLLNVFNE